MEIFSYSNIDASGKDVKGAVEAESKKMKRQKDKGTGALLLYQ